MKAFLEKKPRLIEDYVLLQEVTQLQNSLEVLTKSTLTSKFVNTNQLKTFLISVLQVILTLANLLTCPPSSD